jgi:hypothetical protein
VACTQGRAGGNAQAWPGPLTPEGTQSGAEARGGTGGAPRRIAGLLLRLERPQRMARARQSGHGLALRGGHGGHHRAAQAPRRDATFTLGPCALCAACLEDSGIADRWALVGHEGRWLAIHPTCLAGIEGVGRVGWILPTIARISRR